MMCDVYYALPQLVGGAPEAIMIIVVCVCYYALVGGASKA